MLFRRRKLLFIQLGCSFDVLIQNCSLILTLRVDESPLVLEDQINLGDHGLMASADGAGERLTEVLKLTFKEDSYERIHTSCLVALDHLQLALLSFY